MNTAVINIKTEPEVKRKAQLLARELGMSLSTLVNAYLKQIVRTKTITFSTFSEEPTEYMIAALKEAEEDIKRGEVSPTFETAKEAIKWLNSSDKTYANQIRKKVQKTIR